jgi:ATP-dependent Clp protease protease subunit
MRTSVPDINGHTPGHRGTTDDVVGMDAFSRLMMDRIIFLGVQVNDYVANVIQLSFFS